MKEPSNLPDPTGPSDPTDPSNQTDQTDRSAPGSQPPQNPSPEGAGELPESWEICILQDVGDIVSGGTPSTKNSEFWGDEVPWISPSDLTGYTEKFIRRGAKSLSAIGLKKSSAKLMPAGSVHFSSRAPIGYVVISAQSLCTNQGFKSLVPAPGVFNEYVYFYLKRIRGLANSLATGTTFKELSGKAFAKLPLPLPPLNEQKRIVAKIEELFGELDAGEESLRRARRQLGVYRQSLLKQAFEGKLTAPWRSQNPDLAGTWSEAEVSEVLTAKPNNGRSVKDRKGGFKVLRLTAIKEGVIDLSEHKEGDWDAHQASAWVVKEGDFLASRGNGSIKLVGRGGIVGENADIAFPDTMIRLPLDLNRVFPRYFSYLWNADVIRRQIENSARTTAGIYKINQGLLTRYRLPLCPLPEQREIVRLLDEQFEAISQNEREIDAALKRSEALRQSILRKAFTGRLVPQDPADEPASALLERIREARDQAPAKKKTIRKTAVKKSVPSV